MNPVQHAHLVVKQARAFFDSWFEKFSTWDDFKRSLENNQAPEFGLSADVEQIDKIGNKIGNLISVGNKKPARRERYAAQAGKYYSSQVLELIKRIKFRAIAFLVISSLKLQKLYLYNKFCLTMESYL